MRLEREKADKMKINLIMGQIDSTKQIMDKLNIGVPIIIFYVPMSGKRMEALGYVSGMWVRLFAVYEESGVCEWYFAHIEKYMNHVFDGDTPKLQSLVRRMVGEKKTARAEPLK